MARRHIAFEAGRPYSYVSSIHLADASSAVTAALVCPSGTYNIVDDEPVATRDNALVMSDAVGARLWLRGPGTLALLLGDRTTSMTRSVRVSRNRFRSVTPWKARFPNVREGNRAMATMSK